MDKYFKGIGICISLSSLLAFAPLTRILLFRLSLPCLVYGMGVIIEILRRPAE